MSPTAVSGGETNVDSEVIEESVGNTGATVMGRRMFSGGEGPWEDDPNADAWWGDDPPFHHPVFVLTHHAREPVAKQGGTTFTFVTDGIESALEQARAAAGDKDVAVAGGANVAQQYLKAGLLDELQIHVAPVLLGDGVRLFENHLGPERREVECTQGDRIPRGHPPQVPRREVRRVHRPPHDPGLGDTARRCRRRTSKSCASRFGCVSGRAGRSISGFFCASRDWPSRPPA